MGKDFLCVPSGIQDGRATPEMAPLPSSASRGGAAKGGWSRGCSRGSSRRPSKGTSVKSGDVNVMRTHVSVAGQTPEDICQAAVEALWRPIAERRRNCTGLDLHALHSEASPHEQHLATPSVTSVVDGQGNGRDGGSGKGSICCTGRSVQNSLASGRTNSKSSVGIASRTRSIHDATQAFVKFAPNVAGDDQLSPTWCPLETSPTPSRTLAAPGPRPASFVINEAVLKQERRQQGTKPSTALGCSSMSGIKRTAHGNTSGNSRGSVRRRASSLTHVHVHEHHHYHVYPLRPLSAADYMRRELGLAKAKVFVPSPKAKDADADSADEAKAKKEAVAEVDAEAHVEADQSPRFSVTADEE